MEVVTEEDDKSVENLIDMMTRGDYDSITIEDINRVLFHIVETFRSSSDISKLEEIFDAAAKGDGSAKSRLQEGKSIPNKDEVIPGFIPFEKEYIQILLDGIDLRCERYDTSSGSALHFALWNGNRALAEYLIGQGYPLYKENSDGLTPLDTVCKHNLNLSILLEANIDIKHVNSKGFESLHYALKYQNFTIAKELIKLRGDRNENHSKLFEAIEAGNLKEMMHHLKQLEITKKDYKYYKNMIEVMSRGDFDSIAVEDISWGLFRFCNSWLLETSKLKSIIDATTKRGESAKRKLQEGKSIQTKIGGIIPGFITRNKWSMEILLDGIDLKDDRYNTLSGSALHFALETKNNSLAEYLIEQGYPLYKENSDGLTPLDTVCKYNLDLTLLLKANIDIKHVNSKGFESIHYALKYQNIEIAKKLIKLGGDRYEKEYGFLAAVETGNLEMIKHYLQDPEPYSLERITDYLMELSVFYGNTAIMETLNKKGFQIKDSSILKLAIVRKQLSSLLLLLHDKKEIDIVDLKSLYPFDVLSDKEALITLPSLLEFCGSLKLNIMNEFIEELIDRNNYRCMKVFLKYLSENEYDIITSLLSKSKRDPDSNLLERAGRSSEENFMLFIDFIDIDVINIGHQIYHILLNEKKYKCLKKLFDKTVFQDKEGNSKFIKMDVSFLNSIEKASDHGDSKDYENSLSPTLLHKLNNCEDSKIKFHPVVNAVVEIKLTMYRLWYILTFILYCIFLSSLYFALFNASYQCDNALFSYTGSFGVLRAVCEVVVLIYGVLFLADECMEFAIIIMRFSSRQFNTRNLFKALLKIDYDGFFNWVTFLEHLTSLIKSYFGIFNIIDILGLLFLFLLIVLRLSSSPFQWTLAAFTIIFFTLRLFKYTRIIPSLGAYVKSIFQIFKHDITQFSVIILIIMLAYFGGIHLAARQTYVSPDSTIIIPPDNCSNNSFTGLFWFDQERTSSYDLRRPLLSGIIFLLDGGPGNEEIGLLDSNFLFSLLYLGFAFTIIVVMSNILIAQLSQTYAEVTKNAFLPFKLDLVVSVEYGSNLAFFFGKYLRKYSRSWVQFNPEDWKDFFEVDLHAEILEKLEDKYNILNDRMEKTYKDTKVTLEFQNDTFENDFGSFKEEIGDMKQDVRKEIGGVKVSIGEMKSDFEKRMEHMEGVMNDVLSLLKQSIVTSTK